ncbi:MAG: amidohydrolase family protein [Sphingomonadales bacterium]|nr:amidohydrolase family protein [Sphingomonadales bacterium]
MFERRQALAMIAAAPLAAKAAATDAVTVFEAAKIVTMEPSLPSARFVAVAGGIVLGLADSLAELDPWTRGREVSVDRQFARNVLMPGLIDPHVHPAQSAVMLNIPFLAPDDWTLPSGSYPGVRTKEGYRTRLAQIIAASNAQPFICWGYHELFHGPLGRADLDGIAPDRPVIIWQRSFHDVILNSTAMRDWGFSSREAFDAAVSEANVDPHHVDFDRGLFPETGLLIALARLCALRSLSPDKVFEDGRSRRCCARAALPPYLDMGTGIFVGARDGSADDPRPLSTSAILSRASC